MNEIFIKHNISPVYDENSKILILGSFPSVISRNNEFFYDNPNNRFWKVLSALYDTEVISHEDKKNFLLKNDIALWDVISSCVINKSSDSSIKQAKPCDIHVILNTAKIQKIFINGKTAEKYFKKFFPDYEYILLPSTSSANAKFSLEKLIEGWKVIKQVDRK